MKRLLCALFVLVYSPCSTYEMSSSSVRALIELDAETLEQSSRTCRTHEDESYCSKVEYASRYLELRADLLADTSKKGSLRLQTVPFLESSTDYQSLFEDYIVKNR